MQSVNLVKIANKMHTSTCGTTLLRNLFLWYELNEFSKSEYDCACDLLFIPVRYRYKKEVFGKFINKIMNNESSIACFKRNRAAAINLLDVLLANDNNVVCISSIDTYTQLMFDFVYNRAILNMCRSDALIEALMRYEISNKYIDLQFLYDFFNDICEVALNVTYFNADNMITPYVALRQLKKERMVDVCWQIMVAATVLSIYASNNTKVAYTTLLAFTENNNCGSMHYDTFVKLCSIDYFMSISNEPLVIFTTGCAGYSNKQSMFRTQVLKDGLPLNAKIRYIQVCKNGCNTLHLPDIQLQQFLQCTTMDSDICCVGNVKELCFES